MVRAISAVCVEWKPESMPQATVTKKIGMKWPKDFISPTPKK